MRIVERLIRIIVLGQIEMKYSIRFLSKGAALLGIILVILWSACDSTPTPTPTPPSEVPDAGENTQTAQETIRWYGGGEVRETSYEVIDDQVIVEGDISLGTMAEALEEQRRIDAEGRRSLIVTQDRHRWNSHTIRFRIDSDFTAEEKTAIRAATAAWNTVSDISQITLAEDSRLNVRESGIYFDKSKHGCSSQIGRHTFRTSVHLGVGCRDSMIAQHEIGHAIGLLHEATRTDRDSNVLFNDAFTDREDANFRIDHHRSDRVGPYDMASIMQYETGSFAVKLDGVALPNIVSRQTFGLMSFQPTTPPNPPAVAFQQRWNNTTRLFGKFQDPDSMRVMDVDHDSTDDIVVQVAQGLFWSKNGRDGWSALGERPNSPIIADVDDVLTGQFDAHNGYDVLVVHGTSWVLYSSAGTRPQSIMRATATRDVEVLQRSNIADDVLIVESDGTWNTVHSRAILGAKFPFAKRDMGVSDVTIVPFRPSKVDVVAFVGGRLKVSHEGAPWTDVFAGASPLPSGRDSLDEVWFGHLNGSGGPSDRLDLLTFERRTYRDEGVIREVLYWPAAVMDIEMGATSARFQRLVFSETMYPNMHHDPLIGRFNGDNMLTVAWFDTILHQDQWANRSGAPVGITPADAAAIALYEFGTGATWLTNKYPLGGDDTPDIHTSDGFVARVGARFELSGTFMSATQVDSATVRVFKLMGAEFVERTDFRREITFQPNLEVVILDHTFVAPESGNWRVTMQPSNATSARETAVWDFQVAGNVCGNGRVDTSEMCDDGNMVNTDTCRNTCVPPVCGDGIVDSNETCDDGNILDGDSCPSSCSTAVCGNGIREAWEQCDQGAGNLPGCAGSGSCVECFFCLE